MTINLIHGDCLVEMQNIPDKSIDAIICDLPYGTTSLKWDSVIPFEPLWAQYKRIIKDNGAIVLFGSQPFTSALVMSNPKWFKYEWIWNKNKGANFMQSNYQPQKVHENVLVFSKSSASFAGKNAPMIYFPQMVEGEFRKGRKTSYPTPWEGRTSEDYIVESKDSSKRFPKSIIDIPISNKKSLHPTKKPVPLIEYLIKTYTNEGETVLDNCMGSGTTGVACVNTNRNFIGIELDDHYFEVASERINKTMQNV